MGLFSKKEACPVCGGEVKGLFLKKIGGKQTLCKDCSKAISMDDDLLKNATPEFTKQHLEKRHANAVAFASTPWEAKYGVMGLKVGVNREQGLVYISHDKMDNEDNPTIFSFDSITGYEFYKFKKKLDDADDPGETAMETTMGVVGAVANLLAKKDTDNVLEYYLKLTTTNEYWPAINLKLTCTEDQMFGFAGYNKEMGVICQIFKRIVRKEAVNLPAI